MLKPLALLLIFGVSALFRSPGSPPDDKLFLSYRVDPKKADLRLFWKGDDGEPLRDIATLKSFVETKGLTLRFAMNGGMYTPDNAPLGLFIQDGKQIKRLNKASATGNFYLKPNGVFYITADKRAFVTPTEQFRSDKNIRYATQSGPMLVINGKLHPAFTPGSTSKKIRNGVGVFPNGDILFVMSKKKVTFFDFATFFKESGCQNALFLDGAVSKAYLPEKNWTQTTGDFGVMVGEVSK